MMQRIQSRLVALSVVVASVCACGAMGAESSQEKERQLIAVLRSDAPPQDKAIPCKQLAVYGTKDAVPALAPLLADKELASWARIALEAIPDPAADEALRTAMGRLQGRLLIGVINSIGARRDAQAVGGLVQKLKDADVEVACAAAAALGRIGGAQAVQALVASLNSASTALRAEAAGGCVRCAARDLAEGNAAAAVKLYDTVRKANVPKQKVLEATRGAILARGDAGLPLLLEQLRSSDQAFFGIGLWTARELPGRAVTQAVAAEMDKADVSRQTLLVMVLADRADPAVLPTIRKAAQGGPKEMRLAAIGALERMATIETVPVLLDVAAENDQELAQAARAALVRLPGKEVNADLVARMARVDGQQQRVLIEVAGLRRIGEALPAVVRSAAAPDADLRSAAVDALGILGEEKQTADLVQLLGKAQSRREREQIEKAIVSITGRRGASCLPYLVPLSQSSESELRMIGLHTFASIGGPEALASVKSALNDKEEAVQDEAVRTLAIWAGNWPDDAGVAEPLLALARSGKKTSHQVLGLRGYLQYVQHTKKLGDDEKVAKVKELLPLITRPEEKRLAILAAGAAPTGEALELLMSFGTDQAVAEEAHLALVNTAARDDLKGASKELRQKALRQVVQDSKVDRTKRRAQEVLRKLK